VSSLRNAPRQIDCGYIAKYSGERSDCHWCGHSALRALSLCVLFGFCGTSFMFLRSSMHGQLSHRGDLLPGYESLLMLSPVVVTTFLKMPHLGYERIV
jgi:hypothetical protein